MKKSIVLVAALAAALCVSPLAGCGDKAGKPFDMSDYAVELPSSMLLETRFTSFPDYSSMQVISMRLRSLVNNPGLAVEYGVEENEDMYRLYSMKSDSAVSGWYTGIGNCNTSSPFLVFSKDGESGRVYELAWPTGETVGGEPFSYQPSVYTNYGSYTGENGETIRWYSLNYLPEGADKSTTLYAAYIDGEWKKLTEENIYGEEDDYRVGDELGFVKSPLADPERYPDYAYKDFSYVSEGDSNARKYTFYRGENELGSVTVFGSEFRLVGHYFYYYNRQPVPSEAKDGYNLEVVEDGGVQKFNMTLCRYDLLKNKTEEVDTNYYFLPVSLYYNKTAKDFDRVSVHAYPKTDGVAIVSDGSPCYTFILDEEANISFDLTAKNTSSSFYRLSDNRFLSGSLIMDKEMNTVAQLPTSSFNVWQDQSLIVMRSPVGNYFAVDYDGKVAIAGMSSFSAVCGKYLIGSNNDGYAVFSKDAPEGKTYGEITGDKENIRYSDGLLYTLTEGTYTYYNFNGKKIGEFAGEITSNYMLQYNGKCYYSALLDGRFVTLLFK